MDHFGIGTAMQGMARIYFQTSRRTGRTNSLVQSAKNGDRFVFHDAKEANRVKRLCMERGVKIETIVLPVNGIRELFDKKRINGRTIFDHSWLEKYYLQNIEKAVDEIDHIQRQLSTVEPDLPDDYINKWEQWT